MSDSERLSRAALSRICEPAESLLVKAAVTLGAVAVWDTITGGGTVPGLDAATMQTLRARLPHDPRVDLARADRVGARFVVPGDDEWPHILHDLDDKAPLGLWVRGPARLNDVADQAIAVVGSRASTSYGEHVAAEIAFGLAERDWAVVSGGAYGIDAAAHRGALAAEGVTIAVLACGVDVPYPRGNDKLFDRILATGALASEWPPGCSPMRHRFLTRNRVIAAIAAGTVVVEAGARSGAKSTATDTVKLSRVLMAVPGPVTSALSVGCHQLLRQEGVRCVTNAAEVIEECGRIGELAPLPRGAVQPRDALRPETRRVLEAVPVRQPAQTGAIARTAGVGESAVRGHLGLLVAAGFVEARDGGWRLAGGRRPPATLFDEVEAEA